MSLIGAGLLFPLMLTSCARDPVKIMQPPVTITVTKYVPIPEALTRPCANPVPWADIRTNGDLLDAWLTSSAALKDCAVRIDSIRSIKLPK